MYIGINTKLTAKFNILHEMEERDKLEAVIVDCWKNKQHFSVVSLYNPPGNVPSLDVIEVTIQPNSLLVGDFNSPSPRWGYPSSTPTGRCLEEMMDACMLDVIDTPPTFLSYARQTSRPDLIFTHPHITEKTSAQLLEDAGGCGHRMLLINIRTDKTGYQNKRVPRWNFKKANWPLYQELTNTALSSSLVTESPDHTIAAVNKAILDCSAKAIPRGQVKTFKPFWNATLSTLKKNRNESRRRAEKTKALHDIIALKKDQAKLQREIKQSKRSAFKKYVSKLDFRKDGTKAHRFISRLDNNQNQAIQHPIAYGNKTYTDPSDIANAFCKFYATTSRAKGDKAIKKALLKSPPATCLNSDVSQLFVSDFTIQELEVALCHTKNCKAAGIDEIFPEFLKNLGFGGKMILLEAINLTWTKHVPHLWRKAEIIPIIKKGKPASLVESYRPISLTSSVCKVAEKMICRRLMQYTEANGLIDPFQAGFRKHKGTMDHAVRFTQHVKDGFHRKMSTLAVLVDFKSAYDTVWRPMLIHKLISLGISGNMLRWIKSSLCQRQIRVRHLQHTSKYRLQRQGLAQGAVLSCALFNIMINDVLEAVREVQGIEALLYADDLLIWATSSSFTALQDCINQALKKLEQWAIHNAMTVSTTKTTFQLFSLSTRIPKVDLHYKQTPLTGSDLSKYLGLTLDRRLTWKAHVDECAERASKRSRMLKRLTATKWGATQDVLTMTYKTYIRPILDYGSEATVTASAATTKKLDLVQNAVLRTITGAPKSTPIPAMETQTQIQPLQVHRERTALKFWERNKRAFKDQWSNYKQPPARLKTQATPLAVYKQLTAKYGLPMTDPAPLVQNHDFFDCLPKAKYTLNNHKHSKQESSPIELKNAALQTLAEDYPTDEWLRIYTDGSCMPSSGRTGAGYHCHIFEGSEAVGVPSSNYDGEIAAIKAAASQLTQISPPLKTVFLVDSQAAIMNLTRNLETECQKTIECRKLLQHLAEKGWQLKLQWIPSHVGIPGNEKADELAKQGTELPQPVCPPSLHSSKLQINAAIANWVRQHLSRESEGKKWESLITNGPIPDLPRAIAVAAFRLRTGHDYLAAHLNRIQVLPSPACQLCGEGTMNAEHLGTCPELDHTIMDADNTYKEARLYWSARRLMAQQPRVGVG